MFEDFIGTRPVSSKYQFDVAALTDYLSTRVDGFKPGAVTVEQFKGGQSNPTYKLTTPAGEYVMRSKPGPAAKLLASAHAIDREYRVMQALGKTQVPVPQVHVLCEDESVIGRAFYIMQCVQGRVLWDQSLPDMTNAQRGEIYDEMNRVIALMHTTDYNAIGLTDYGKPGNYFMRQIERWTKQYRASQTDDVPAMESLIEWLPQHVPADDGTSSIVHGDFRMDNLIFHPTQPRVLAILDWELSTLGHPLADFSYHAMAWNIPPGAFRGIAGLDHVALGIPSQQAYIEQYCQRTGRNDGIPQMNFYLAYNMFRLAGILQGIKKRVVDGTAASEQAKAAGEAATPLAKMGWSFAQKAS